MRTETGNSQGCTLPTEPLNTLGAEAMLLRVPHAGFLMQKPCEQQRVPEPGIMGNHMSLLRLPGTSHHPQGLIAKGLGLQSPLSFTGHWLFPCVRTSRACLLATSAISQASQCLSSSRHALQPWKTQTFCVWHRPVCQRVKAGKASLWVASGWCGCQGSLG